MRKHRFYSPMTRWITLMVALMLAALAAACGGGGAGAGGTAAGGTGGSSAAAEPASMLVTTSVPSIGSDGRTSATILGIVKDASNRTLANQQVEFATTDAGSRLQVVSARTDITGVASATLLISDPTNRTIDVSARSGVLAGSVKLAVAGTQIVLSGPTDFAEGATYDFSVNLRDSSGAGIASRPIVVTPSAGISASSTTLLTDGSGNARFQVTGLKAGTDTLALSALGATISTAIRVSAVQVPAGQVIFSAPTALLEVPMNVSQPVSVQFLLNGVPQVAKTILFFATRGQLSAASAVTDAQGRANVNLSSDSAGAATITAVVDGVQGTQRIVFVSRAPGKLSLQSSPSNVAINLDPLGTNSSQLIAVVRDVADNPVKGALVSFSAVADASNGRIEPATALSDSYGVAKVSFFPGPNSTGNGQVRIQAGVAGTSLTAQTALTASGQALIVRAGSGNTINVDGDTTYVMPWTAIVTDSSGNPVAGASIQASLIGVRFLKGAYAWSGLVWVPKGESETESPFSCLSEDSNQNLRLDTGEDRNGNNKLDPAGIALVRVVPEDGKTDAFGGASLQVRYAKTYANWAEVRLRVTVTTLGGTEGAFDSTFVLPVLASDVAEQSELPPGATSPFGKKADCTTTE